jgi:hypothetical protein
MMDQHQQALVSLLLGSFPNFQSGDAEAALAAYEIVLSQADERDLQPGVMMLINGEVAGHDGRFAPTAPQLAKAIRQAMNKRVDEENARRAALPAPDDEWVDDPPEVKARNKARLDQLAADLAATLRTEEAETERKRLELGNRTNARFAPSFDQRDMARRLGFSVGDPDAEAGDMGERAAS